MSIDFQQVQRQVQEVGEKAPLRQHRLNEVRQKATGLLESYAGELQVLREKVQHVVHTYDPNLRCALPVEEPLNVGFSLPELPAQATIIAADGSQIAPDRHAQVDFCLINVGAIQMRHGSPQAPEITVRSNLFYDEALYTETGTITVATLALLRDLEERTLLAELAAQASPPVVTFTDGPMELWGATESQTASEFQKRLDDYLQALSKLHDLHAITAGYVDKPAANLVVRLLELASLEETLLPEIRKQHPLRGVTDNYLYRRILAPGERSAVFALQSHSAAQYRDELALHFFYLNVGRPNHPWLARVEIPAWVAYNPVMLEYLHAALIGQCRIMGGRRYPYLLHRAHETAVVSLQEKEQVTQMLVMELRRRGVEVDEISEKQAAKEFSGRTRYER